MPTKTDPLAGIPSATTKPARQAAAPVGGSVVNLATAKAERKRRRLTGQEYKDARDFARRQTGYNDTSPIWGKRMPQVLTDIEAILAEVETIVGAFNDVTSPGSLRAYDAIQTALQLNRELQKRVATGQLIGAQT